MAGGARFDRWFAADVSAADVQQPPADPTAAVTVADTFVDGIAVPGGLFDPAIFGTESAPRWGYIDVPDLVVAGVTVQRVPVPPPAWRMPAQVADPAARSWWHGPLNDAWLELMQAIQKASRSAQWRLDCVLAMQRGAPLPRDPRAKSLSMPNLSASGAFAFTTSSPIGALMMPCAPRMDAVPRSLLFLADNRLLLQTTDACCEIDWTARALGPAFAPTGPWASSVLGDVVVFNGGQRDPVRFEVYEDSAWPEDAVGLPLAAYDLAEGRYLESVDDRIPRWVVDESGDASSTAYNTTTQIRHPLTRVAADARQLAQTHDGRFAWLALTHTETAGPLLSHAIVELASQRPFVLPPMSPADLPAFALGAPLTSTQPAVSYAAETGWRLIDPTGAIGDGTAWFARIVGATVTAWSPDGRRLATVVDGELMICDVSPAGISIVSRAMLSLPAPIWPVRPSLA